ncbi:MAG: hypothetical protein K2Q22_01490, partial [Cytophagales bacterium]|nr:hypothetical protein [Cytophagales bacterium]
IPIIVGGTGFYIQSVLYGIDFKENDGSWNTPLGKFQHFPSYNLSKAIFNFKTCTVSVPNNPRNGFWVYSFTNETNRSLGIFLNSAILFT